jgi:hypothetical protein
MKHLVPDGGTIVASLLQRWDAVNHSCHLRY